MAAAAGAIRAERERARLRLGKGHEIASGLHWHVIVSYEQERSRGNQRDWSKVTHRIVPELGIDGRVCSVRAPGTKQERVAVLRRLRYERSADRAPSSATVLDDHRLPQHFAQTRGNDARHHIDAAARRERHDDLDYLARIRLGQRPSRQKSHQDNDTDELGKRTEGLARSSLQHEGHRTSYQHSANRCEGTAPF